MIGINDTIEQHVKGMRSEVDKMYAVELKKVLNKAFTNQTMNGKTIDELSNRELVEYVEKIKKQGYIIIQDGGEMSYDRNATYNEENKSYSYSGRISPITLKLYKEVDTK